ncbi:MAG: transglutaminase family protein, partial [Cyanobacteria bacterium P01_H01_bin.58]
HPAATWPDLVQLHQALDEAAIACGLTCHKYALDGRPAGTGGGAHITIGGTTPQTSPLFRRPDLLRSLITYWQHHPSLSYAFAGQYIGPTSQAPRVDEGHHDSLYELELAFLTLARCESVEPSVIDRLLTPLMQDVTGNTHRTALCIDKLFPHNNPHLQLGLLEFRGFEMPPETGLRLLQMLLIRACVAWFWHQPFTKPLKRWGAELRDRWLLPHYLIQDFAAVLADLRSVGYTFKPEWFTPFWEHRFPRYGQLSLDNPSRILEVHAALEPWPVMGEVASGGTARPVNNSLERIQITLSGAIGDSPELETLSGRYTVLCNGQRLPMRSTGVAGKYVGGVRFRARSVGTTDDVTSPHVPLRFHVIDTWQRKFIGGVTYHVQSPTGRDYEHLPTSAEEGQARLAERFVPIRRGLVPAELPPLILHPEAPMTLDLRLIL